MATKRDMDRPQSVPPANSLAELHDDQTLQASSSLTHLSQLDLRQGVTVGSSSDVVDEGPSHTPGRIRASRIALRGDPEYRRYAQTIERALLTFDSVAEWADFISFLSRLHKALISTAIPYLEIPHKLQIAKRLAQGLNPALPNGVHQRTLEVYRDIFKLLGKDGLKRDLPTWSSGLFPCFQYASTAVRPTILEIYETYYLPLERSLRPASKALALALLPGLEEETGDHFDRVLRLVDKISTSVDDSHFLQSVLVVLITHPGSRISAVNYLTRRLPSRLKPIFKSLEDGQTAMVATVSPSPLLSDVIGPDGGLFVRALSSGLQDDNVLVRRGTLDMLNTCLPLPALLACGDFSPEDKRILAKSACSIVLRKDLSLNKRLYGWLVGDGDTSEKQMDTFRKYGLDLVAESLREDMSSLMLNTAEATKAFRIFVSLLDRWEVGYPLSIVLIREAMTIAMIADQKEFRDDVVRDNAHLAARAVYEAVEPYVFWCIIYNKLKSAVTGQGSEVHSTLRLVIWVLNTFRIQDDEVTRVHLPLLLQALNMDYKNLMESQPQLLHETFQAVLVALPWKSLKSKEPIQDDSKPAYDTGEAYYCKSFLYRPPDLQRTVCPSAQALLQDVVQNLTTSSVATVSLSAEAKLFAIAVEAGRDNIGGLNVMWQSQSWLSRIRTELQVTDDFGTVATLVNLVCKLNDAEWLEPRLNLKQSSIIGPVADALFRFMRPNHLHTHLECSALLWEVADATSPSVIRNAIMRALSKKHSEPEDLRAFAQLWSLTQVTKQQQQAYGVPLFFVLNNLHCSDVALSKHALEWMHCDFELHVKMLDITCETLLRALPSFKPGAINIAGRDIVFNNVEKAGDLAQTTFTLRRLVDVLNHGGQALADYISSSQASFKWNAFISPAERVITYRVVIQHIVTDVLLSWRDSPTRNLHPSELHLHLAATAVLRTLAQIGSWAPPDLCNIINSMISRLFISVQSGDLEAQPVILDFVRGVFTKWVRNEKGYVSADKTKGSLHALGRNSLDANDKHATDWLNFVMTLSSAVSDTITPILYPISRAICDQIHARLGNYTDGTTDIYSEARMDEGDIPLLFHSAVLIVRRALPGAGNASTSAFATPSSEPAGLFGYVTTVLSGESGSGRAVKAAPTRGISEMLQGVVGAALAAWEICHRRTPLQSVSSDRLSESSRGCLKELLEWRSFETLDAIVERAIQHDQFRSNPDGLLQLLDSLELGSHRLIQKLCDMMSSTFPEGNRSLLSTQYSHSDSSPSKILKLLDLYITRAETPVAIDILPVLLSLARAVVTPGFSSRGLYIISLLSSYFRLLRKVARTSAFNDRRLKKDALDCLARLLEAAIQAAQGEIRESPAHRPQSLKGEEHVDGDAKSGMQLLLRVLNTDFLPNILEVVQQDNDRITQMTSVIGNWLVASNPKPRSRVTNNVSLEMLQAMEHLARLPQTTKIWRPFVLDKFNDAGLFNLRNGVVRQSWIRLFSALLSNDKERIVDLLDRSLAATSAANIFISREQETVQRAAVMRRVSLCLFVCPKNQYLVQLPTLQTRVVELLRMHISNSSVMAEVYLLLRIILCRFGHQHLSGVVALIVSELVRAFESMLEELPQDNGSGLQIALAVCKLLDLMLTLGMDEFQMHQWLFVTDTSDVLYPDDTVVAGTLVNQLSEAISAKFTTHPITPATAAPSSANSRNSRRPGLAQMKSIDSLAELQPFLLGSGIKSFEGMYSRASVDWDYVDRSLEDELFDA